MRFLLLILFLLPLSFAQDDSFSDRLMLFHKHYSVFFRTYLGCPKDALLIDQCDPKLGRIDYLEYHAARREAARLFELPKPQ